MTPPKRIAVDFDGTLCYFAFPDIGPPKKGAAQALALFRKLGYKVIIWSCRACHWDYDVYGGDPAQPVMERDTVKAMVKFLDDNGIEYDEIDDGSRGKPSADYYIDDKGIRFDDNWTEIVTGVMNKWMRQARYVTPTALKPDNLLPFVKVEKKETAPLSDGPQRA